MRTAATPRLAYANKKSPRRTVGFRLLSVSLSNASEIHAVGFVSKETRLVLSASPDALLMPALSPDNRTLYYVAAHTEADLWLITLP